MFIPDSSKVAKLLSIIIEMCRIIREYLVSHAIKLSLETFLSQLENSYRVRIKKFLSYKSFGLSSYKGGDRPFVQIQAHRWNSFWVVYIWITVLWDLIGRRFPHVIELTCRRICMQDKSTITWTLLSKSKQTKKIYNIDLYLL